MTDEMVFEYWQEVYGRRIFQGADFFLNYSIREDRVFVHDSFIKKESRSYRYWRIIFQKFIELLPREVRFLECSVFLGTDKARQLCKLFLRQGFKMVASDEANVYFSREIKS